MRERRAYPCGSEPFAETMWRLVAMLDEQFKEPARLEAAIRGNLPGPGFGGKKSP